jgi:tetratricopeptide (TPR) repeat protein
LQKLQVIVIMTKSYFLIYLLLISELLLAQQPVFRSQTLNTGLPTQTGGVVQISTPKSFKSKKDSQDIATKKQFAPIGVDIKILPLFGEYLKTPSQQKEDEEFVKMCQSNFANLSEASQFFSARGWDYLQDAEMDTATHRFNLAYLLDDENVDAYWGLGVVTYQKGEVRKAILLMQRGNDIDQNDPTLMVDLATLFIEAFVAEKQVDDLSKAFSLLEKAVEIQPELTNAYMQLAFAEILNGQLDHAWEHFHKGYEIDPEGINDAVLIELLNKKADPKGIFKK